MTFWRAWEAVTPFFAAVGLFCTCSLIAAVALVIWLDLRRARYERLVRAQRATERGDDPDREMSLLLADELPPAPVGWER